MKKKTAKAPPPPSTAPSNTPPPSRSLADRVGKAFAPRACVLGYGIFARGAVTVEAVEGGRASILVAAPGKRKRSVVLQARPGALEVACTCGPHDPPLACRHVWAAILELDRRALAFGGDTTLVLSSASETKQVAPAKRTPKRRPAPSELADGC